MLINQRLNETSKSAAQCTVIYMSIYQCKNAHNIILNQRHSRVTKCNHVYEDRKIKLTTAASCDDKQPHKASSALRG